MRSTQAAQELAQHPEEKSKKRKQPESTSDPTEQETVIDTTNLPDEILAKILLSGLSPADIYSFMETCLRFRSICDDYLWKKLLQRFFSEEYPKLAGKYPANLNWRGEFNLLYKNQYYGLSETQKKIFSAVRSGDFHSLKKCSKRELLNLLRIDGLVQFENDQDNEQKRQVIRDNVGYSIIDWATFHNYQDILQYFYEVICENPRKVAPILLKTPAIFNFFAAYITGHNDNFLAKILQSSDCKVLSEMEIQVSPIHTDKIRKYFRDASGDPIIHGVFFQPIVHNMLLAEKYVLFTHILENAVNTNAERDPDDPCNIYRLLVGIQDEKFNTILHYLGLVQDDEVQNKILAEIHQHMELDEDIENYLTDQYNFSMHDIDDENEGIELGVAPLDYIYQTDNISAFLKIMNIYPDIFRRRSEYYPLYIFLLLRHDPENILEYLFSINAVDMEFLGADGMANPLIHCAVERKSINMLKQIIKKDRNRVNERNSAGEIALMHLTELRNKEDNLDILKIFMESEKFDPLIWTSINEEKGYFLHAIPEIVFDNFALIKEWLSKYPEQINLQDANSNTIMMAILCRIHESICGMRVISLRNMSVFMSQFNTIEYLMDHPSLNPNVVDLFGETFIHMLVWSALDLLEQNFDRSDHFGLMVTPIQYMEKLLALINKWIEKFPETLNSCNKNEETIAVAACHGLLDAIEKFETVTNPTVLRILNGLIDMIKFIVWHPANDKCLRDSMGELMMFKSLKYIKELDGIAQQIVHRQSMFASLPRASVLFSALTTADQSESADDGFRPHM